MKTPSALILFFVLGIGLGSAAGDGAKTLIATVGGQVRRTGPVELTKTSTLYEVIQAAGGPNEFGAQGRVKIFRDGKIIIVDLRDDQQKMTKVLPSDTIEVPSKNLFGR